MRTNSQQIASESNLNNLHRQLGQAQDEFYGRFTEWNVSRQKIGSGRQCYELALAYLDAIDRFLECLNEEIPSPHMAREIQNAGEWKSILSSDLNYLSRFRFHGPRHQNLESSNGQNGNHLETDRSELPTKPLENRSAI